MINEHDKEEATQSEHTSQSIIKFLQVLSDVTDIRLQQPKLNRFRRQALDIHEDQLANDRS